MELNLPGCRGIFLILGSMLDFLEMSVLSEFRVVWRGEGVFRSLF